MPNKTPKPEINQKPTPANLVFQLVFNFVLPIFVLTRLSTPDRLGAAKGLVLALAFPVVYELYSVYKRRKLNMSSVVVIGGILITGALGLFKVNAFWLALRRAVPYSLIALALLISEVIKRPLMRTLLKQVLDIKKVENAAKKLHNLEKLRRLYRSTTYLAATLAFLLAISAFVTTRLVVVSAPLSSEFNEELAKIRVYNIPTVIVPLIVGILAILLYLFFRLEKITGLDTEELTK